MKTIIPCLMLTMIALTVQAQSQKQNVRKAKEVFEAFNAHDWDKMLSYYAADAVFEDPAFKEPVTDVKFMTNHHRQLHAYFPDIRDEVKAVYGSGDHVIVEFISTGTSVKGEKLRLPICTVFTFRDGKIIRDATYYDNHD